MKSSFLAVVAIALALFSCNSDTPKSDVTTVAADTTLSPPKGAMPVADTVVNGEEPEPLSPLKPASAYVNITVLQTDEGLDEEYDADRGDYEDSSLVAPGDPMRDNLATYGVAHQRWVAPKGWTGHGLHATNEGIGVYLYPPDGNDSTGPGVEFHQESSCEGCKVIAAATYFANARRTFDRIYNSDGSWPLKPEAGLRITKVSPKIVTYILPTKNGIARRGVAYYYDENDDTYFSEMKVRLPEEESELMDYLIKRQVAHYKAYTPF